MDNSSVPASSSATTDQEIQNPVAPWPVHDIPADGAGTSSGVNTAPIALCAIARHHQVAADPTTRAHQLGLSAREAARGHAHSNQRRALGVYPAVAFVDTVTGEKKGAYYPAILTLSQKDTNIDGKRVPLSPCMNVTAEIKTGKRRVIEYLLSPVQKAGSESLRDR